MHRFVALIACLSLPAVIGSCGADHATGTGDATEIEITVVATGLDPDIDFGVNIDGYFVEARLAPANSGEGDRFTARIRLVPGTYTVELTSIAVHCTVAGANPRPVIVGEGEVTPVRFEVTCFGANGVVTVTANTTGPDTDLTGYLVAVGSPLQPKRVAANGDTVVFTRVPAGTHSLVLFELAPYCTAATDNPRTISVPPGGPGSDTVRVTLRVTCAAPTRVVVTVTTTGVDFDADGYLVAAAPDGTDQQIAVPANGVTTIPLRSAGSYWAQIDGLSPNCRATSQISIPFVAPQDDSAAVGFTVLCEPANTVAFVRDGAIYTLRSSGHDLTLLTSSGDSPAWSPDGDRLAFTSTRSGSPGIYVMNADVSGATLLRPVQVDGHRPAWHPDGSKLAYVDDADGNGRLEIHVMNSDGTGAHVLIESAATERSPAWSPDGTRIAFSSMRDGVGSIYVANADGSGITRLAAGSADDHPAWSPDGSRIVFERSTTSAYNPGLATQSLLIMNADGSGITTVATGNEYRDPAWSPDGAWIAFHVRPCDYYYGICFGQPSIRVIRPEGNDMRLMVPETAVRPAWRP